MRTIVLATAAAAVFSGCVQAFAPMAGAPGLRPAAARSMRSVSSLRMAGDSMDDIMARLAAMENGGGVAAAPAPAYEPPAAAAPPPAAAPAPAYQPPAAAAPPPAYQVRLHARRGRSHQALRLFHVYALELLFAIAF